MHRTLLAILLFASCTARIPHEKEINSFLQHAKNEEYDAAKSMIWKNGDSNNLGDVRHDLERLHTVVANYDVPNQGNWTVRYDTSSILKLETITVPFRKVSANTGKLKEANLEVYFEYKGAHIGDSIFNFTLSIKN